MKHKKIITAIILFMIICLTVFLNQDNHSEIVDEESLNLLAELDVTIYGCYDNIYKLNTKTGKWDVIVKKPYGSFFQWGVDIYDNQVYYCNSNNGFIERRDIDNPQKTQQIFKPLSGFHNSIKVEKNRILYTCDTGLREYDILSKQDRPLCSQGGWIFSSNGKDVIIATKEGIVNIADPEKIIANVRNVSMLSNNRVVSCNQEEDKMQVIDIDSQETIFSFSPKAYYTALSDENCEFICVGRILQKGFVTHKMGLTVYEVATGKEYKLPDFPIVTHCFILKKPDGN